MMYRYTKLVSVYRITTVEGNQKMSEAQLVEVTLKLPKRLVNFLKDMQEGFMEKPAEEYLTSCIIDSVRADVEAIDGSGGVFSSSQAIIKKYGLQEVFKDC
jgi:hypothetical protein